jgi:hypothetical protein
MYYHYSLKPITLSELQDIDSSTTFTFNDFDNSGIKPGGLWLSDGTAWENLDHRIKQMYKYKVTLKSNSKLLTIDTAKDIESLRKYGYFKNSTTYKIKWNNNPKFRPTNEVFIELYNKKHALSDDYDGIIIKNYDKSKDDGTGWYRLIDINCACIWRPLKCIEEWTLISTPTATSRSTATPRPKTKTVKPKSLQKTETEIITTSVIPKQKTKKQSKSQK